jgi:HEAT repeat protein
VRRRAIEALRKNSDSRTIDVLIEMLDDFRVRDAAVTTLIARGDKRAVTRIIEVIKKEERISVVAHAKVLAAFRDERAIRPLIQVLTSQFRPIDAESRRAIADALSAIGAPAVEPLIALLDSSNPDHREAVIMALGNIRDLRVEEALIVRFRDEADLRRKTMIAEVLGNYDDPRIVDLLVEQLQKLLRSRKTAWARKIIAHSLVKIYQRAQIPPEVMSKILSHRRAIINSHSDLHQDKSYSDFSHLDKHSDNGGIGVNFPL